MDNFIIKNGVLVDKQNGFHSIQLDVAVANGKIQKIEKNLSMEGYEVIDASGQYIAPGFIDAHIHHRKTMPVHDLGSADHLGVYRGSCTIIECGTVCVDDLGVFANEVNECKTRYYALLSGHGEDGFGKAGSQDVDKMHIEHYKNACEKYPGLVVGLKVACSNTLTNDKGYGLVKKSKEIANALGMPLTIHVGTFPPDPCGLVEFLDKNDVITHTYHGKEISLFKADGTPKDSFVRARKRGVRFDVGHGSASFSWSVYDKARRKGFFPDMISTDIRKSNINGPVYSLAVVMSKLLNLGMELEDVIKAVTYTPAEIYQLKGLGELKEGAYADFTFFTIEDVEMELVDCYYQYQPIKKLICPVKTIVSKGGQSEFYYCNEGDPRIR